MVAAWPANAVSSPTDAFELQSTNFSISISIPHSTVERPAAPQYILNGPEPTFASYHFHHIYIQNIYKMSVVSLLGVNVLNNPAKFSDSYEFEITFECLESLQKGQFFPQPHIKQSILTDRRSRMEVDLCRLCHLVRPSPTPHPILPHLTSTGLSSTKNSTPCL